MTRVGRVNTDIELRVRFYVNGVLYNPFDVDDVKIYASPGGSVLATITPTQVSTGIYQAVWSIPAVPAGTYYDQWTWTAESGMDSQTRLYDFRVQAITPDLPAKKDSCPLFVGQREVNFFHGINKELIQRIVCQKVIYYSVSIEQTQVHRLYDEAMSKTVYTPVKIDARILYNEPEQKVNQFSIDTIYKIEVYFYQEQLRERKLIPREGDFVKFGDVVYEIEKLNRPQLVYGQIAREVMVKAACRVARESQIKILDEVPAVNCT